MNDTHRNKRLEAAQLKCLFHAPFFNHGVLRLPVTWDDSIRTAATNGKEIRWNRSFFDWLPNDVLPTVLCHEVAHCMLGHIWRMPAGGEHDRWNQAIDHATNLMLKEFSALQIAQRKADPFPFPQPESAYLADPQYAGMSEEAIYYKLPSFDSGGLGGVVVAVGSSNGQDGGKGNGAGGKESPTEPHSMPSFGDVIPQTVSDMDTSASKRLQTEWEATLLQSLAAITKGYGKVPGSLERYVKNLVSPKVNWVELLRSWLREQCADDWDFLNPAMEYEGCGFMLPSLKSEKMGPVVFGSDWSGSTFGELVEKFHAEKQGCLDDLKPSRLVDIAFDTRVISVKEYAPGDTIDPIIKGGGGTSFVDVIARCEAMHPQPKCVVILTDCEGEFGPEPSMPVLWVTWTKDAKVPWGTLIHAE